MTDVSEIAAKVERESAFLKDVVAEVESVIVGQRALIDGMLVGLLADGHVLIEGVPGLAKSLAVQSLASALGGTFHRDHTLHDVVAEIAYALEQEPHVRVSGQLHRLRVRRQEHPLLRRSLPAPLHHTLRPGLRERPKGHGAR